MYIDNDKKITLFWKLVQFGVILMPHLDEWYIIKIFAVNIECKNGAA